MSKVLNNKKLDQITNRRALIIRILSALYATLFLLTYGCVPNKSMAPSEPTPTLIGVKQSINITDETISTFTPRPSASPNASDYKTPEATEEPIENKYFLFSPTEEELKALETAAEEYYERLKGNYNPQTKPGLAEYTALDIVKICCGDFDNFFTSDIELTDLTKNKEKCLWNLHNHVNAYIVTVNSSTELMYYNKFDGISFQSPETYKIFKIGGFESYPGVTTLRLVEETLLKLYNSMKQKDIELLIKNTQALLTITEMVFIQDGGIYEDTEVTAFSKMYPTIKLFVREEIVSTLLNADIICGSISIQANDSSEYNLYQLTNMILDDALTHLVDNEILALMDAYIEAEKSGKITRGETTESSIPQNTLALGN